MQIFCKYTMDGESEKNKIGSEKKLRKSVARDAILSVLSQSTQPISAYRIMGLLANRERQFNKTTVYRELETLRKLGSIHRLFLQKDVALYELSTEHPHHILCTVCGDIQHIDYPEPKEWRAKTFVLKNGFRVIDHSLEFFGICQKCQS